MSGFKARISVAKKFLPEFGVAAYCGMGRVPPEALKGVLEDHLLAANSHLNI